MKRELAYNMMTDQSTDIYYAFARLVLKLNKDTDYVVDEKAHTVMLTEEGVSKVEKLQHR